VDGIAILDKKTNSIFQRRKIHEKYSSNGVAGSSCTELCGSGQGSDEHVLPFGRLLRLLFWVQVSCVVETKEGADRWFAPFLAGVRLERKAGDRRFPGRANRSQFRRAKQVMQPDFEGRS
jgi:hypothetical protein